MKNLSSVQSKIMKFKFFEIWVLLLNFFCCGMLFASVGEIKPFVLHENPQQENKTIKTYCSSSDNLSGELSGKAVLTSPDGQIEILFKTVSDEGKVAPDGGQLVYTVSYKGEKLVESRQHALVVYQE